MKSESVSSEQEYTPDDKNKAPSHITFQRSGCFILVCFLFYASETEAKTTLSSMTLTGAGLGSQELRKCNFPVCLTSLHVLRAIWEIVQHFGEKCFALLPQVEEKHSWKTFVCISGGEGARSL